MKHYNLAPEMVSGVFFRSRLEGSAAFILYPVAAFFMRCFFLPRHLGRFWFAGEGRVAILEKKKVENYFAVRVSSQILDLGKEELP